jgi:hypothetical protein
MILRLTSSSSTTETQCEHAHRHYAAALSAVNVGIIGEDVGDGLRGIRLESHCDDLLLWKVRVDLRGELLILVQLRSKLCVQITVEESGRILAEQTPRCQSKMPR